MTASVSGSATTASTRLLAIRFDDPLKAQELLIAMMRLQNRGSLRIEDAAIVSRMDGRVRIHQTRDLNPSQGVATGTWFGALAGLVFMQPLIGAAIGAALGGLWAKLRDIGIDDEEMREMGDRLADGDAALFLLLDDVYATHLSIELARFDGSIVHSTFDEDATRRFSEALAGIG
jgi:uncharacterized membrane protein